MRIEPDVKLDYSNVLIRPKRSKLESRKDVDLERNFKFGFRGVPIMAANMDGVGTFEMAKALAKENIFTCLVKSYSVQELVSWFDSGDWKNSEFSAMTIGILDHDHEKFRMVYEQVDDALKYVCIDVANGYSERFVNFVSQFKTLYPKIVLIAGNVCTADQTQELILNGADIVKVGIGPGSVCTTRIKTGIGYPQLSSVMECADAAHGVGGCIIADGGCTTPGDVVKAFSGGSDFVMLGGMLAGHDEGGGEVVTKYYNTGELVKSFDDGLNGEIPTKVIYDRVIEEKKFVQFYGMSSATAQDKHSGGLKNYRASEGRDVLIPYKDSLEDTLYDILGGIRSACTYVGARTLKDLSKCTTFVQVNNTHNRIYED